ncbi:MAG: DNA mismatch repair protein MutS [Candidatus Dojkabacteria bacterium]
MKKTPMMEQYDGFKRQYPDKLLLFRMGDFYETFGEDAKKASKILNITLTTRDKKSDPTPLAGFPHHALDQYLPKIIEAGESAVIVDQIEDPKVAVGVVKRAVTRIVTPGTVDGELASNIKNSYLMALYRAKNILGIGILDVSTGEFKVTEMPFSEEAVSSSLTSHYPNEVLIAEKEEKIKIRTLPVQIIDGYVIKEAENIIKEFYSIENLDSLGIKDLSGGKPAIAMLLHYIQETQKMEPEHIETPKVFNVKGTMVLDRATVRNLDLVANSFSGNIKDSLFGILDETRTLVGRRTLYSWILNPLLDIEQIQSRQLIVREFINKPELLTEIRDLLGNVSDIERIVGKVGLNRANGRDLKALQLSLESAKSIANSLNSANLHAMSWREGLEQLTSQIEQTINDAPPLTITEGRVIKTGFNSEVDELRSVSGGSKTWLKEFEEAEKAKTGISSLKVSFNNVFGYYIEVTKIHQSKVPEHYIRKQTLVNSERYITEELKRKEEIILGAEGKLAALEYKLFQEFRATLLPKLGEIKGLAAEIARIDVLASFAEVARNYSYIQPTLHAFNENNGLIKIVGGRHPVIERLTEGEFVSNDTEIRTDNSRMCIITGPNMSGKSTFIRQVAVLVLMAQIGSFIPAKQAEITLVDRIFSRVGASDDLSQGRSTFMVEMEEAANILNNATENSLVILDEVGRGTSTYDGVSIAWALSEYLVEQVKARTLFATHYHELLRLAQEQPEIVKNYNVYVKEDEEKDEVVFMRKIVEGGTDRSYGIYVAKLAGLPEVVVKRARAILQGLEGNGNKNSASKNASAEGFERLSDDGEQAEDEKDTGRGSAKKAPIRKQNIDQFSFFGEVDPKVMELVVKIQGLDLENMTPLEALRVLEELKKGV